EEQRDRQVKQGIPDQVWPGERPSTGEREHGRREKRVEQPVAARKEDLAGARARSAPQAALRELVDGAEHGRNNPGGRHEHPRTQARLKRHASHPITRRQSRATTSVAMTARVSAETVRVFLIAAALSSRDCSRSEAPMAVASAAVAMNVERSAAPGRSVK